MKKDLLPLLKGLKGWFRMAMFRMLKLGPEILKEILIQSIRMPVTEDDLELLEETKRGAREHCIRHIHHTFCLILGKSGKKHEGLQQTYRRAGDLESCAEVMAKGNCQFRRDIAVTVAVVHFYPMHDREDGGVVTIVPPCASCSTRLRHLELQQGAGMGVLVFYKDLILKVPPKYAYLFTYPVNYNNDNTPVF